MISLKEIAEKIDGRVVGDAATVIQGLANIKEGRDGDIVILTNPGYRKALAASAASALVLGDNVDLTGLEDRNLVLVKNPSWAYLKLAQLFHAPGERATGVHPLASVSPSASIAEGVSVGAYACIEGEAVIEGGVTIHPFVYVGERAVIGEGSTVHPHVVLYDRTVVGKRVTIHGGSVIGADGFGYMWDGKSHVKIPQLGSVEIEDDVEIGANVTIDRASLGKTRIGRGVRIDNQVMIAHNVSIGENSIIVAQVGIAGSAVIGKNVVLAGQVGVRDHATVGDFVQAGGRTGITHDVPPKSLIMGNPHMPHKDWARLQGYLRRLPKLFGTVKRIAKKLDLEVSNGRDQ